MMESVFFNAIQMLMTFDTDFINIVALSLYVSLIATLLAAILSIFIASILCVYKVFGKSQIILIFQSLMSLPPVVVGLVLYLIYSYSGPLGYLDLLYTPTIMIIAQIIIVTPIIVSLAYSNLNSKYTYFQEYFLSLNTSNYKKIITLLFESRYDLIVSMLTGLGRALSEVGAVIIVGGNISHMTRVMTTSIVLETSRGELALALSLGIALIIIALILNIIISIVKNYLM